MRRLRVLIAVLLLSGTAITPASAAGEYRYWSYWQSDSGTWQYAKLGPAMQKATDGAVDGWRYGVGSTTSATPPQIRGDFDSICGTTAATSDQVRVAVVIDYGNAADAPPARTACAVVTKGLSRASALAAVAPLRLDQGFVCGIDAYPASGCGESVNSEPSATGASPKATASKPATTASGTTTAEATSTPAPTTGMVAESATAAPNATPDPTPTPQPDNGSVLPTIVTMVLAVIALVLALRNARLQQEMRRR